MKSTRPIKIDVINETPVISTLTIAENLIEDDTKITVTQKNKQIVRLINENIEDFEDFTRVGFQNSPFETKGGIQEITIAELNEEQYFYLMTLQRNTPKVKEFKKNATKAFFLMKEKLQRPTQPTQTTDLNPLIEVLTKSIEMQNNRFNHLEQEIAETKAMMSTIKENSSKFVKIEKSNEAIEQYIKQQPIDADQVFMLRQAVDDRAMELAKKYNIHSRICKDFIYSELRGIFEVRSYIEIKRAAFKNALFRVNRMDMQSYIQIDFPGIGIVNPKKDIADEEQED